MNIVFGFNGFMAISAIPISYKSFVDNTETALPTTDDKKANKYCSKYGFFHLLLLVLKPTHLLLGLKV